MEVCASATWERHVVFTRPYSVVPNPSMLYFVHYFSFIFCIRSQSFEGGNIALTFTSFVICKAICFLRASWFRYNFYPAILIDDIIFRAKGGKVSEEEKRFSFDANEALALAFFDSFVLDI